MVGLDRNVLTLTLTGVRFWDQIVLEWDGLFSPFFLSMP
jgi:hypothetical protein